MLLLVAAVVAAVVAPVDPAWGPIQKVLYLHLPVAITALISSLIVFIACVAYLGGGGTHRRRWESLANAAARVTVLNGTVLLLTGVFWAKVSWDHWWVWSPRLVFSLVLWLLYIAYLAIRPIWGQSPRASMVAAVYGVVAFLDVPLLYLSAKLLPDVHPTHISLTPEAKLVLGLWMVATFALSGGLIAGGYALGCQQKESSESPRVELPRAGPRSRAA